MMKRLLALFLLCLVLTGSSYGQGGGPLTPASSSTGSIFGNSASCYASVCVLIHMAQSNVGYSVAVSGTWTGTLAIEQSGDNQVSWAAVTTTTINTLYTSALTPGITDVRVRGSAAMTGSAVVTITASGPATLNQITQTGGSGGITSVSSLPALPCTNGTTVYLNTGATGNYTCINSIWVGPSLGGGFSNTVSPASFGVKADVKMCRDTNAQFTTTTSVTCLTANYTSTDVGKVIFGTCCGINGGSAHQASTLKLPQGTITAVNSTTNVTVSVAGTSATCAAGSSGCLLLWGTDDSAAWDAAWTGATGTAGVCQPIAMPAGMSFISSAKFLTTVCNTGITGPGSQGTSIFGLGYKTSMFVLLPNFNTATCTGVTISGGGNVNCFGPSVGLQLLNMGIWGGEYGNNASFSGKILVNMGIDSYMINTLIAGISSASTTTLTCVNFDTSGQTMVEMVVDGCGGGSGSAASCDIKGGNYNSFSQSFCGNTAGNSLHIATGAVLSSYRGGWGGSKTSTTQGDVIVDGFFNDTDGIFFGCTSACANLVVNAGSTTKLNGSNLIGNGGGGSFALFFNNAATAKVYARNTFFNGGAANQDVTFGTAMGFFNDQGGNTFLHANSAILPACTFTSGGGTSPSCALQAGSTNEKGTIIATTGTGAPGNVGTITLTFAGAGLSGGTATTPSCTTSPNDSGTAWGNEAVTKISTQSITAPIIAWSNDATAVLTALATSSPYRIDYVCIAR